MSGFGPMFANVPNDCGASQYQIGRAREVKYGSLAGDKERAAGIVRVR